MTDKEADRPRNICCSTQNQRRYGKRWTQLLLPSVTRTNRFIRQTCARDTTTRVNVVSVVDWRGTRGYGDILKAIFCWYTVIEGKCSDVVCTGKLQVRFLGISSGRFHQVELPKPRHYAKSPIRRSAITVSSLCSLARRNCRKTAYNFPNGRLETPIVCAEGRPWVVSGHHFEI